MDTLVHFLTQLAPPVLLAVLTLIVIGGLAYIIFLLVQQGRQAHRAHAELTSNHLHDLPDIADTLRRMESKQDAIAAALLGHLADIRVSQATIIAKLNGKH